MKNLKSDEIRLVDGSSDSHSQKNDTTDDNNPNVGIMPYSNAQKIADAASCDLVLIAPAAAPPVCRVMDYGKYRFEQKKREKELHKAQKQIEIKEIRLRLNIDSGDLSTKVNNAIKFLKFGDKVKVSLRFVGREISHKNLGQDLLLKFQELCSEVGIPEAPAKLDGKHLILILAPLNDKRQETKTVNEDVFPAERKNAPHGRETHSSSKSES